MNTLGKRIGRNGWTLVSGRTWHPTVGLKKPSVKRRCYELEWDENGDGTATGNFAEMTEDECDITQQPTWVEDTVAGTRRERVVADDGFTVEWRETSLLDA